MLPASFVEPAQSFIPLSQLPEQAIDWLWRGRLADGNLSMVDGDPGLGKSLFALDLAARVTTGRPLADGSAGRTPSNVVLLSSEDSVQTTIIPRLRQMGADLDRVFIPPPEAEHGIEPLRFPSQVPALDLVLGQTQAKLVVIDPVVTYLDRSINSCNDQSVRRALRPLAALANKHRCVILLVRHLNKRINFQAIYRGGGSIGFVGSCRSSWLVAHDPNDQERCVLAQVKNNLAGPQPSLAFTLVARDGGPVLLSWLGVCDLSAKQLLDKPVRESGRVRPRERACALLGPFLREAPRTSEEVWQFAQKQDISLATLRRAKVFMEVRSVRVWDCARRRSYWLLPGQQLPANIRPNDIIPDLQELLAPLGGKIRESTPIDDL